MNIMEKFECGDCGRKFDTRDSLDQHRKDKHLQQQSAVVKKSKLSLGKILTFGIIILVVVGLGAVLFWALTASTSSTTGLGAPGSTHIHMDWKVYLNGKAVDVSIPKYQKPHINQYTHMEGGDGNLIHVHATGATFGFFLNSIGLKLDSSCLTMDTGEKYCNEGNKTLKFYLNGKANDQWDKYLLKNLDKILISYGNESEDQIKQQLATITDKAKNT